MTTIAIPKYQKIRPLGHNEIAGLFTGEVEVTEKLDGSMFAFGVVDGELYMRSKGRQIQRFSTQPNDLFWPTVNYVEELFEQDNIPDDHWFYGEAFRGPKHSTLRYNSTPSGHFALWGVRNVGNAEAWYPYDGQTTFARFMGVDQVQRLVCPVPGGWSPETILQFLDTQPESQLGGVMMEGVVVKSYDVPRYERDDVHYVMAGKYVSEQFKETNEKNWKAENTPGGKWAAFKSQFHTEARWRKAIGRMNEDGILTGELKDIGQFINYIQRDIGEECKPEILKFLWSQFGRELLRESTRGAPEWYKEQLALGEIGQLLEAGE